MNARSHLCIDTVAPLSIERRLLTRVYEGVRDQRYALDDLAVESKIPVASLQKWLRGYRTLNKATRLQAVWEALTRLEEKSRPASESEN